MVNGVVRVWADESREQELWAPPGSPTDFFSGTALPLGLVVGQTASAQRRSALLFGQMACLHV